MGQLRGNFVCLFIVERHISTIQVITIPRAVDIKQTSYTRGKPWRSLSGIDLSNRCSKVTFRRHGLLDPCVKSDNFMRNASLTYRPWIFSTNIYAITMMSSYGATFSNRSHLVISFSGYHTLSMVTFDTGDLVNTYIVAAASWRCQAEFALLKISIFAFYFSCSDALNIPRPHRPGLPQYRLSIIGIIRQTQCKAY